MGKKLTMATLLCLILFTACGMEDKNDAESTEKTDVAKVESSVAESVETVENTDSEEDGAVYLKDEFTLSDYLAIAERYGEEGLILKKRDTLEQAYRLFQDETILDELKEIYVNLDEEKQDVSQMAGLFLQNAELDEYRGECFHMLEDREWFETMMPKLYKGVRNYYSAADGRNKITITVGYDENGIKFSNVFYYQNEEKIIYMGNYYKTVQYMETGIQNGAYNGSFTLWTMNGENGNITKEAGTFQNGEIAKEGYRLVFHKGAAPVDVFDLYKNRDNVDYVETKSTWENRIGSGSEQIGIPVKFAMYESIEKKTESTVKIRVFDGEIQILTEKGWISAGYLEDYEAADIFRQYAEEKFLFDKDEKIPVALAEPEAAKKQEATGTTNPQTSTGAGTTKPQTTPAVKPNPVQTPTEQEGNQEEESNDPAPEPEPEPTPEPAPAAEPAPAGTGNETDIEWTDDLL